ncbi:MAG: single-stranded DNA-binding protein [Akkermansiaceae bacterium]|nr:single-stranded DNA-binding protein [Akkermansiaceae bacterium]
MASLNKVMLLGNLTRDPELRHTPKGSAVTDLGLALNRRVQDGNGGWKEEVTFVDVTVWGNSAENAHKYLSKGRGVFVEGRLQMDTWDDKETGKKRSKLKVVADNLQFLSDGKGGGGGSRPASSNESSAGAGSQGGSAGPAGDFEEEDDIPF